MNKKKFTRFALTFMVITSLLAWDLSQADQKDMNNYKSYNLESRYDALSSATTKVSIVRSDDENLSKPTSISNSSITYQTIEDMVREAIELAGGLFMISPGDMVLLKPNIVDADPSGNGEITDVRVIKALIKIINEIDPGNMEIVVGEASPQPIDYELEYDEYYNNARWGKLWDKSGYQDLLTDSYLSDINFRLSNLNGTAPKTDWYKTNGWPSDSAWKDLVLLDVPGGGEATPQNGKYWIHKDVLNADAFISVPVMKIHTTGLTAALKNQIGIAPSTVYGFWKQMGVPQNNYEYKLIHEKEAPQWWTHKEIVDLSNIAGIDFVVIDAIACLEREKDAVGNNLVRMNTILAGSDPVAVDNVCARLMCLNPDDVEHITLAEKVGLGTNNPNDIIIKGADLEQTKRKFKKAYYGGGEFGQGARTWLVNGPFSINGVDMPIDHEFISGEKDLVPQAEEGDWSEAIYFTDNRIDLKQYFDLLSGQHVASYAACYFTAQTSQKAELWIGSDEALKIYLNGEVVYKYNSTRSFPDNSFTSTKVNIDIEKGGNRLLVKSIQKYSRYDFCLNICEPETNDHYDGNRVSGLKFTSDSDATGIFIDRQAAKATFDINAYPNPFSSKLNINYSIEQAGNLDISIFNLQGMHIKTLYAAPTFPGNYSIQWNGENQANQALPSGQYFLRIRANDSVENHSIIYIQ